MKFRFLAPLLPLLAFMASCSEDFEVSAPYKDITVVYGLLNQKDTAQYIRIQKAFLDENKNALEMAKEVDSNFYKDLTVQLRDLMNGNVVSTTTLPRVDLNLEGFPKNPGEFFTSPSWAYKVPQPLALGHTYRLVITNNLTGNVDSAETPVITSSIYVAQFENPTFQVAFNAALPQTKFKLDVTPPENAAYMSASVRFRWTNRRVSTGEQIDDSVEYFIDSRAVTGNQAIRLEVLESSFYPFLQSEIGPAPEGIDRYLDSATVMVYAATKDFYDYLRYTDAQGGITGDQIRPIFTNIKGKDVLGIFAARSMRALYNVPIRPSTLDSLKNRLPELNIKGVSDH